MGGWWWSNWLLCHFQLELWLSWGCDKKPERATHRGCHPSMDVVFSSKVPKIVLGFARVELQMIKIKFFQFPSIYVIFHCSNLPRRLFSIFSKKNSIVFSLTSVNLQMLVTEYWGFSPRILFFWNISEPYNNSFWEKSNPGEEREKRKNAVNSGHLVPWQLTQGSLSFS